MEQADAFILRPMSHKCCCRQGYCAGCCWCQKARPAPEALSAPLGLPHPAREPISAPLVPSVLPQQGQSPVPYSPARPWAPCPREVPDGRSCGCPLLAGLVGPTAAVSNIAISSIQKRGSCQQSVRKQKHPGTILAEENRKSSWSCL